MVIGRLQAIGATARRVVSPHPCQGSPRLTYFLPCAFFMLTWMYCCPHADVLAICRLQADSTGLDPEHSGLERPIVGLLFALASVLRHNSACATGRRVKD